MQHHYQRRPAHRKHQISDNLPTLNPFAQSTSAEPHLPQPPPYPSQRDDSTKPLPSQPHAIHSPFVNCSVDQSRSSALQPNDHPSPPKLPPRKPPTKTPNPIHTALVPPRYSSILLSPSGRRSVSPSRPPVNNTLHTPPPPPPTHSPLHKIKPSHITSTLMKQAFKQAEPLRR
jgi:hypothetical protein